MIKKWTVTFGPRAKRELKYNKKWRESAGFEKATKFVGHFMYALAVGGLPEDRLPDEIDFWGAELAKIFFSGRPENDPYRQIFVRGTRAAGILDPGNSDGDTHLNITFHGKDINQGSVSWKLGVIFLANGDMVFCGGMCGRGLKLPDEWFACP